jgi:glycosyltransferase
MKHIYLFNEGSRAAVYGIGTYIRELTDCLKDQEGVSLHIVQLFSDEKEYKVIESKGYKTHYFPSLDVLHSLKASLSYRNVWYILSEHIQVSESDQLIFHLNYYREYPLIELAKRKFPMCKVLFAIHYQNWCFKIKGNVSYFKRILHTVATLLNEEEKEIIASYEREKKLLQKVDHIICLARFTQNLLIEEYGIPKENIFLINNGLKDEAVILSEEEKIELKKQLYLPSKGKIILFVGRLDEIKGLDFLIQSFKQVITEESNCRLVVVGDGEFSTYLKECKGYWNKITFTGHLEKEDLFKFYQIADIGVQPSFHEQCSYVAIEMMMFGIPLIISTSTGLCEMIENNDNRIGVIEEKEQVTISSTDLAKLIVRKLRLGEENDIYRRIYSEKYTLEHMSRAIGIVYGLNNSSSENKFIPVSL